MTVDEFPEYLKQHELEIGEQLRNGTYLPQPVKRVEIPKPDGSGMRKLGIPTVLDRFVQIRRRIKSFTKRRAPIRPAEFVKEVNQTVRGWVNYYRHTNASDAFRRLQRFINTRFRRYLNYRSKGRGFGWKKYPNAALYSLGIIYVGSGVIRYE